MVVLAGARAKYWPGWWRFASIQGPALVVLEQQLEGDSAEAVRQLEVVDPLVVSVSLTCQEGFKEHT